MPNVLLTFAVGLFGIVVLLIFGVWYFIATYDKRLIIIHKTGRWDPRKYRKFDSRMRVEVDKNSSTNIEIRADNIFRPAKHRSLAPNEYVVYMEGNVTPEGIGQPLDVRNAREAEALLRMGIAIEDEPTFKAMLHRPMPPGIVLLIALAFLSMGIIAGLILAPHIGIR